MKHVSAAMPNAARDAMRLSEAEHLAFAYWWLDLDVCLEREGVPYAAMVEALPMWRAGWTPEAAAHEVADRRLEQRPGPHALNRR